MMTNKTKLQHKIRDLADKVDALEHQHYINSCSDNFYHSSGRYKEMKTKLDQERKKLNTLKQLKENYYGA